jgi:hypothetical protein
MELDSEILNDEILKSLKTRYFKLLQLENIGKTHKITSNLDTIEASIIKRKKELTYEYTETS